MGQRVAELDAAELFAQGGGQHLPVRPALQAGLDQRFGDQHSRPRSVSTSA
jgi:hypothetical protein